MLSGHALDGDNELFKVAEKEVDAIESLCKTYVDCIVTKAEANLHGLLRLDQLQHRPAMYSARVFAEMLQMFTYSERSWFARFWEATTMMRTVGFAPSMETEFAFNLDIFFCSDYALTTGNISVAADASDTDGNVERPALTTLQSVAADKQPEHTRDEDEMPTYKCRQMSHFSELCATTDPHASVLMNGANSACVARRCEMNARGYSCFCVNAYKADV